MGQALNGFLALRFAQVECDRGAAGVAAILVWLVLGGPWVGCREWSRCGGACQAGDARAAATLARRRAACAHAVAAGQAEAMAILIRRTEMRTSAPILSSLSRIEPQVASAKVVCARPMRRS